MFKRAPDSTETNTLVSGEKWTVNVWEDPCDTPYDGEFPEDAEGCEGWDICVEVEVERDGFTFTGCDSLGSNRVTRGPEGLAYLRSIVSELTVNATADVKDRIRLIAGGSHVKQAREEQRVAAHLVKRYVVK